MLWMVWLAPAVALLSGLWGLSHTWGPLARIWERHWERKAARNRRWYARQVRKYGGG